MPEKQVPLDVEGGPAPRRDSDTEGLSGGARSGAAAGLEPADQDFLDATAGRTVGDFSPTDIDRELEIAQRIGTRSERDGKVVYDLPNGHAWELHPDGTMCRHSSLEHCLLFLSFPLEGHLLRILAATHPSPELYQIQPLREAWLALTELNKRIRQGQIDVGDALKAYEKVRSKVERIRPGVINEMADPENLTKYKWRLQEEGRIAGAAEVQFVGKSDFGLEGPQAVSFGRIEGGGTFQFIGKKSPGIEGTFLPAKGGDPIPVSFKNFTETGEMWRMIGKINENKDNIPAEHVGRVYLHVIVHQWTKHDVGEFIEGGPIFGMPSEGTFKKMIFECSDGILELTRSGLRSL